MGFFRKRSAIAVPQNVDIAFNGRKRCFEFVCGQKRRLCFLPVDLDQHLMGVFKLAFPEFQTRADLAYQIPAEEVDATACQHESERDTETGVYHGLEMPFKNGPHRNNTGPFQYQRHRRIGPTGRSNHEGLPAGEQDRSQDNVGHEKRAHWSFNTAQ